MTRKRAGETAEVVETVEKEQTNVVTKVAAEAVENTAPETVAVSKEVEKKNVYIGPTIPKTNLFQYTILTKGLPNDAQKHAEACPAIGKLVVPYAELAEARQTLEKAGTPENMFYEQVLDYLKGRD